MRITVTIEGDLAGMMVREVRAEERAVTLGVHATGAALQADLRAQVAAARLGTDLTKSVRKRNYPAAGQSISAASLVYSKASKLLDSFDRGSIIRSRRGLWLAIPLAPAGGRRSLRNNRSGRFEGLTPAVWERRNGQRLRFVYLGKARAPLRACPAQSSPNGPIPRIAAEPHRTRGTKCPAHPKPSRRRCSSRCWCICRRPRSSCATPRSPTASRPGV